MRKQVKYLNVILTIVAVLLMLNLFKNDPTPAYAATMGESLVLSGPQGFEGRGGGPIKVDLGKVDLDGSIRIDVTHRFPEPLMLKERF
jgi:hypothetical protein